MHTVCAWQCCGRASPSHTTCRYRQKTGVSYSPYWEWSKSSISFKLSWDRWRSELVANVHVQALSVWTTSITTCPWARRWFACHPRHLDMATDAMFVGISAAYGNSLTDLWVQAWPTFGWTFYVLYFENCAPPKKSNRETKTETLNERVFRWISGLAGRAFWTPTSPSHPIHRFQWCGLGGLHHHDLCAAVVGQPFLFGPHPLSHLLGHRLGVGGLRGPPRVGRVRGRLRCRGAERLGGAVVAGGGD